MSDHKSILIVDDVIENVELIQQILAASNYETHIITSGESAIDLCKTTKFDLILLDVRMPEMDGFQAAKLIKTNTKNTETPILFLVVKTDDINISNAFKNKGVDIITKPFQQEELLARVNTHLMLQSHQNDLIELNLTKDKFLNVLAHDLRNPFNSLLGFSQLLKESLHNNDLTKSKKYTEIILKTSIDTFELLNNLLSWANLQRQGVLFNPETLNLYIELHQLLKLIEDMATEKNIEIYLNVDEQLMVFADKEMLKTIIRNLITNAIKFSNENGVIKIKASIIENNVEIRVSDTGIGMDEITKNSLFNVLETKTKKGTKGEPGTGFGLILCKEFIEKHQGKIWVESEEGKGSEFIFNIPVTSNL